MSGDSITLAEAARISAVSAATLRRWAREGIVPLENGSWTRGAASQARVVARMRDRGHSLGELRKAAAEGRLAVGLAEDVFADDSEQMSVAEAAERTGVEEAFVERLLDLLGTPVGENRTLSEEDRKAIARLASVAEAGLPLEAVLQLVRIYAQSVRRIADAEVRLVHLFVHEPMIREGKSANDISEELSELAANTAPTAVPLFKYLHQRYLRYFMEQDVVGHMEDEAAPGADIGEVKVAICFIDLTGFTRFTEEEGDVEALLVIESFTEAVRATLPARADVVKSIGDEVACRVGGRLHLLLQRPAEAAGRGPLRRCRVSRRRLLRQSGQPRPPGRQPCPRWRGPGHRSGCRFARGQPGGRVGGDR
jgi:adenylate cyclase